MKPTTLDNIARGAILSGVLCGAGAMYHSIIAIDNYNTSIDSKTRVEVRDAALDSKIEHLTSALLFATAGSLLLAYGSRRFPQKNTESPNRAPAQGIPQGGIIGSELYNETAGRCRDRGAPIPDFVLAQAGSYDAHSPGAQLKESYRSPQGVLKAMPDSPATPKIGSKK